MVRLFKCPLYQCLIFKLVGRLKETLSPLVQCLWLGTRKGERKDGKYSSCLDDVSKEAEYNKLLL